MNRGHDPPDQRGGREGRDEGSRPQAELRWVQLREPLRAVEVGANGRVLASRYHPGYDSWEILLETYEGELD